MKIDGHSDRQTDIAWLRFEGFDPATAVSDQSGTGLRDLDPSTGATIGLEYWRASEQLPAELLEMLPPPPVGVPA